MVLRTGLNALGRRKVSFHCRESTDYALCCFTVGYITDHVRQRDEDENRDTYYRLFRNSELSRVSRDISEREIEWYYSTVL